MSDDQPGLESLKLLRETTSWMVGVQTLIFGFLITLLNAGTLALDSPWIKGAVAAFCLSIVCAGIVLGTVPWLPGRDNLPKKIRRAPIVDWPGLRIFTIGLFSLLQLGAFVAGIGLLLAAVMGGDLGPRAS